jgi:hypothetical protein
MTVALLQGIGDYPTMSGVAGYTTIAAVELHFRPVYPAEDGPVPDLPGAEGEALTPQAPVCPAEVRQIPDSIDRDSMLAKARQDILARIGGSGA